MWGNPHCERVIPGVLWLKRQWFGAISKLFLGKGESTMVDCDVALLAILGREDEEQDAMSETVGPGGTVPNGPRVYLRNGHDFERWTVERHVADGAMSSVFRARYSGLRSDRPKIAALKITPMPGPVSVELLVDEYNKALWVSEDPNVVEVFDVFKTRTDEAGPCVVLIHELGDESLANHLEGRRSLGLPAAMDQPSLKRLATDLVKGMTALHNAGLIHSDIKPANILRFGSLWKLGDLGTAAVIERRSSAGYSAYSHAVFIGGTRMYSTPEHLEAMIEGRGEPPQLHRDADIWAFGIVLHEAATGRTPFETAMQIVNGEPEIDASLPSGLQKVVTACLAPIGSRLRSADELRDLLIANDLWQDLPPDPDPPTSEVPTEPETRGRSTRSAVHEETHKQVHKEVRTKPLPPTERLEASERPDATELAAGSKPLDPGPGRGPGRGPAEPERKRRRGLLGIALLALLLGAAGAYWSGIFDGDDDIGGVAAEEEDESAVLGPVDSFDCSADDGDQLTIGFVESDLLSDTNRAEAAEIAIREVAEVNAQQNSSISLAYTVGTTADNPTAEQAEELIRDCPDALVTNLGSAATLSVLPTVTDAGVVQVSVNATSPLLSKVDDRGLAFRVAPSDEIQGRLLATKLSEGGKTTAAVIYLNDAYGSGLKDEFEQNFESRGSQQPRVIAEYGFEPGRGDALAEIDPAEIDRVVDAQPEAIVVIGFPKDSAEVARLLHGAGYDFSSVWFVDGNVNLASHLDDPGILSGAHQTVPGFETTSDALSSLRERLALDGEPIGSYTAQAYDAIIIIALAAAAAESSESFHAEISDVTRGGEKCATYVECLEILLNGGNVDYEGLGGPYEFTDSGEPSQAIYQIDTLGQDGQPDQQKRVKETETLCGICDANDRSLELAFGPGQTELDEADQKLEEIARIIMDSNVSDVIVEGYASTPGSKETNDELAEDRALFVKGKLEELGVPEGVLTAESRGATDKFLENRTVFFVEGPP